MEVDASLVPRGFEFGLGRGQGGDGRCSGCGGEGLFDLGQFSVEFGALAGELRSAEVAVDSKVGDPLPFQIKGADAGKQLVFA